MLQRRSRTANTLGRLSALTIQLEAGFSFAAFFGLTADSTHQWQILLLQRS